MVKNLHVMTFTNLGILLLSYVPSPKGLSVNVVIPSLSDAAAGWTAPISRLADIAYFLYG